MRRVCIYPKDIQIITGKSERHSRNIINTIKTKLNKDKHQAVTIEEFSNYMGLKITDVEKLIK